MPFKVTLIYKDETYTSDSFDNSKYEEYAKLLEDTVKGKAQHLSFTNHAHKYYFPTKVLQESIITITEIK